MLTPCLKGSVLDVLIRTWIIDGMAELSMEICFIATGSKGSGFQPHLQQRFTSLPGALSPTQKIKYVLLQRKR